MVNDWQKVEDIVAKNLVIVGAGGHGKVVADAASSSGEWDSIAFLDDRYPELQNNEIWPVVGKTTDWPSVIGDFPYMVIGIGNNETRLRLQQQFQSHGFKFHPVVHRTAVISPLAKLGGGTVVFANAVVNPAATVGLAGIINTAATVDHDCVLGDGVQICPGAHLAGGVKVGNLVWVGIGAAVREYTSIGDSAFVGAGGAVVNEIQAQTLVVGVPAKSKIRKD